MFLKKTFYIIFVIVGLVFFCTKETQAVNPDDVRVRKLKTYLAKNKSPLFDHAELIVDFSDKHEIPYNLIVSIAGVESTFCKFIPKGSYNCWGWNNGKTKFTNYPHAVETVITTLRKSYFNKGLTTPERISRVYAPPSPKWGSKVRYFMNKIDNIRV